MNADSLRIERIEAIGLRVPLDKVYRGSKYSMQNRCTIVTRIYTRGGVVGEVYTGDTDREQADVLAIITNELAPALIGLDAFNIEGCWEAMRPATFDILRDRALALQAIACVDTALWDVFGKSLAMPLYKLWGGYRDALPLIAIGGYYGQTLDELAREVETYVSYGVSGMKFKVGGATPQEDLTRLRAAQAAAPADFIFMADANQGYTLADALTFVRLAREAGIALRWFEEPVRWYNDRRWLRDMRAMAGVPITAGQSEYTLNGVRDLIAEGSVDVSNFDSSWGGGPTIWRKAAALAYAYGVEVGHHEEAHISAHLLCSQPHGTYAECFHKARDPIFWQIQTREHPIRGGHFHVSDAPGFGLSLDPTFIARYRTA